MGRPNTRPQLLLLAALDNSLPGVRLISALAADDDDEAVFADPRRFEMAVEVVSGFTPSSLLIFSLISSAAAEASSSQRSSEQRGLGFAAEGSDAESAISRSVSSRPRPFQSSFPGSALKFTI